jgi:hypothetical protein
MFSLFAVRVEYSVRTCGQVHVFNNIIGPAVGQVHKFFLLLHRVF